jgi:4-cresol dehydrogenase (hydroxylating)
MDEEYPFPPGFDMQKVLQARRAFEAALGASKVFFEDSDRETYKDKFAVDFDAHHPLGAVAPESVEEVQTVVRIANQFLLPIWPISRGKNLGYGGSAPLLKGSVVLDMSRMKAIQFDEQMGTVVVEPGVGFYDLYDYIQAHSLPYWLSTPGNSWGSVMGNALDRGMGYTPYGEHAKRIIGLEVVLPNGELVRTGMGAFSNAPTWQGYAFGFGPGWDQMFVQSNFGIVTKMGLWLMPEPEVQFGLDAEFASEGDLKAMVDAIAPLKRERVIDSHPSIGNWLRVASTLTTRDEWTDKPGALGDDVIDAIRKRFGLGWWGVSLRVPGREDVAKAQFAIVEKAIEAIGPMAVRKSSWTKGQPIRGDGWSGTPITFPMQNANWYGGRGGHIGFSPIIPQDGTKALEQFQRTYARYKQYGMDYQGSFAFGERHMINVNAMLFNQDSPEHLAKIDGFFRQLVADAKAQGYGEYRTHLDYMDLVAGSYDWNNGALLKLNEKIKDALDPNGIIAPGKSGIWPNRLRGERGA